MSGLLDQYRKKLQGLLGDMPLLQIMRGEASVSPQGLLGALRSMPVGPDPKGAYEAALNVGPMMLGAVGRAGAVVNTDTALSNVAKKHFGKTYNPSEAGYMTVDGEMLDLSGRHYGPAVKPGERDWYRGQRQVDHRELGDEIYQRFFGNGGGSGTEAMRRFMNEANMIRMQPNIGFETSFVPTKNQLSQLERIWGYAKEPLAIDVANPKTGDVIGSTEISRPTAKKIENYIKEMLKDYTP